MLKKITKPVVMPYWWQDLILTIPRVVYGYLLAIEFGASKFGMPWTPDDKNLGLFEVVFWFPEDVKAYGGIFAMFPGFFAWMGAFSEAVGGIFLVLGLQTRLFSFLIVCTMMVAVFIQQIDNGLWSMLSGMGFLWVAVYTMILGSGRFGFDYLITKKQLTHAQ
jgi:putative oxidoreductase